MCSAFRLWFEFYFGFNGRGTGRFRNPRIATWARKSYGPKPPSETTEARRNRILQSYGMKSMEELRNRY